MKHLNDSIKGLTEDIASSITDYLKEFSERMKKEEYFQLMSEIQTKLGQKSSTVEIQSEIQAVIRIACDPDMRIIPYICNDGLRIIADRIMIMRKEIKKLREENERLKQKQ